MRRPVGPLVVQVWLSCSCSWRRLWVFYTMNLVVIAESRSTRIPAVCTAAQPLNSPVCSAGLVAVLSPSVVKNAPSDAILALYFVSVVTNNYTYGGSNEGFTTVSEDGDRCWNRVRVGRFGCCGCWCVYLEFCWAAVSRVTDYHARGCFNPECAGYRYGHRAQHGEYHSASCG